MAKKQSKFGSFIQKQNFIKELNIVEHIIVWTNVLAAIVFLIIQLAVLKLYGEWSTWVAFVASITSIFSVMAGAKKRILCPVLGTIASVLLFFIAFRQKLYGSMIMYAFNMVVQIITAIIWIKESNDKVTIKPRHVKPWVALLYLAIFAGLTALFTWIEGLEGFCKFWSGDETVTSSSLPIRIFDSAVLIFTIATVIPMFRTYDQVWWVYVIVDIALVCLWITKGIENTDPKQQYVIYSTLVTNIAMLATCVAGIFNWSKKTID